MLIKLQNFFEWTQNILKFLKMVFYALLARPDPLQSRLKVQKNLLFSSKMACFRWFLLKKADSLELWGNIAEGLDMLEEHKRPFLKTSECCAFIQKSFKALRAVFLIFFHDWKLAYNSAIKCLCLDFCAPLYLITFYTIPGMVFHLSFAFFSLFKAFKRHTLAFYNLLFWQ